MSIWIAKSNNNAHSFRKPNSRYSRKFGTSEDNNAGAAITHRTETVNENT
jgi:hypothetical protein